jgi:hypothetical protein
MREEWSEEMGRNGEVGWRWRFRQVGEVEYYEAEG